MTRFSPEARADVAATLGVNVRRGWLSRLWRGLLWCGAAVAVLAAGMFWRARAPSRQVRYETEPVRRGDLVVTVSATGRLEPMKEVDVGIEVSGTIKTVEADCNDSVTVGQALARLDTSRLEASVLQSEGTLAAARARVAQAQATAQDAQARLTRLTRLRELSGGKMPAEGDLETAQADLARAQAEETSAKAAVAQATATVEIDRTDLTKAVVRSPIDGVVLKRQVEPGQTVVATFQSPVLFTLAEDLARLQLRVDVDEADVGRVCIGQEAAFTVDAYPERTFPARITKVLFGSEMVNGVVTYKALLDVDNAGMALRPGMTATASIVVNQVTNAILVANAALRFLPPQKPVETVGGAPGGLVGALFPHPPPAEPPAAVPFGSGPTQEVWTVRLDRLTPVAIVKGATDGQWTEVRSGPIEPGMELATEMAATHR